MNLTNCVKIEICTHNSVFSPKWIIRAFFVPLSLSLSCKDSLFHVKMGEIRPKINASTLFRFLLLLACCFGHTIALLIEQLVLYNMILFSIYFNCENSARICQWKIEHSRRELIIINWYYTCYIWSLWIYQLGNR